MTRTEDKAHPRILSLINLSEVNSNRPPLLRLLDLGRELTPEKTKTIQQFEEFLQKGITILNKNGGRWIRDGVTEESGRHLSKICCNLSGTVPDRVKALVTIR